MKQPPIRVRITIWFAVAMLTVMTPYAVLVLGLEWGAARRALDHHLEEDLEVAAQMLRRNGTVLGWATPGMVDPGYDAGAQRWVEVFAEDGRRLYTRGIPTAREVQAALPHADPAGVGYHTARTPAGAHVRLLTARHRTDGTPVLLRVARSETEIRDQWRGLLLTFLLSIPLAVAVSAVSGYIIAGRTLAPIDRMVKRARGISADRLHERLPVENPDDELGRLAEVFNEMFQRLERSFGRLKRFTADASHELRTPLTALRSVGEVGLREPRSAESYREIIGSMLEEADRLTRLIESLLTLSRWDTAGPQLVKEPFDLGELARDVTAQLGVLAEEKGVELRLRTPDEALAHGDRSTIRQAVMNLVDNAIKYTAAGTPIDVTVECNDGSCHLTVADRGPGIAAEHRDRIFDRFYRVDQSRSREIGGAGLGLAIAHWAVTANQGRLTVDSKEGLGSRFTITLPIPPGSAAVRRL